MIDERTLATETSRAATASQDDKGELVHLSEEDSNDSRTNPNVLIELALRERDAKNARAEFKRVVQE